MSSIPTGRTPQAQRRVASSTPDPAACPARGTKADHAIELAGNGFFVFPLHWVEHDQCSCGDPACRREGKHPYGKLVPHGNRHATRDLATIQAWWSRCPNCNIGIDLERSGVLIVGPDNEFWLAEFHQRGLPETMAVQSGSGVGHEHFYYRLHERGPTTRRSKSVEYDVLSAGYVVAAGSITDNPYIALTPLRSVDDLPIAPDWAVAMLTPSSEREASPYSPAVAHVEPPVRLSTYALEWWSGARVARRSDGAIDRSGTLFALAVELGKAGSTERTIAAALEERDVALNFPNGPKFSGRPDAAVRYLETARKALNQVDDDHGVCNADDVDALNRRYASLQKAYQQLQTENRDLRETHALAFAVLHNPALKGHAKTALAIVFAAMSATSRHKDEYAWVITSRAALAESAGCSTSTIGHHLNRFVNWGIVQKRVIRREYPNVDPTTGDVITIHRSELQFRLVKPPVETMRDLATLDPDRPRWGGKREDCSVDSSDVSVGRAETTDARPVQRAAPLDETVNAHLAIPMGSPTPVEDVPNASILRVLDKVSLESSGHDELASSKEGCR